MLGLLVVAVICRPGPLADFGQVLAGAADVGAVFGALVDHPLPKQPWNRTNFRPDDNAPVVLLLGHVRSRDEVRGPEGRAVSGSRSPPGF